MRIAISACGVLLLCGIAHASGSQVIVDGGERMGDVVHQGGHDVSMLRALEQIVPRTYSVMVPNAGEWADKPVSWRAGSVVRALGDILSVDPSLQARVNTDLHVVTVAQDPRHAGKPHGAAEMHADAAEWSPQNAPVHFAANVAASAKPPVSALPVAPLVPARPMTLVRADANANGKPDADAGVPIPRVQESVVAEAPAAVPSRPASSIATYNTNDAKHIVTTTPVAATSIPMEPAAMPLVPVAVSSTPASAPLAATPSDEAAAAPPAGQMEWQMRTSDGSVRNALARWANEAGWQFIWDVPTDFAVDATATIHGTLQEALSQVTDALSSSQVPIQVVLYTRNRVLRVVAKGANS
ncbi:TcpQ domain-containing protein [Paraburkholderia sp. Ac-20336]|uniref:toxin co-regulated pilus biosynthesis Q family protein n=1 Tax=Paraburkholderia sp. Ac-20336 TaxID=2703886 RepID=UPI00321792BE